MNSDPDHDLTGLRLASDRLVAALSLIGAEHVELPTPCEDWDLQALVDHIVGGNWFTCLILRGLTAEHAMDQTIERFGSGSATTDQATASVAEQQRGFEQSGALDQLVHHVAGDLTGRQAIRLRLHDLIAHTWDLEQSLGRDSIIPEALVRWGLDELASQDSLTRSLFATATITADQGDGINVDSEAADYLRQLGRRIT